MKNINSMIDHTLLRADASLDEIRKLCQESIDYEFAAVCVNPSFVREAYDYLKSSQVKVATVIGFPLGASTKETKAFETRDAINNGSQEIDMVINISALKDGNYRLVEEDIGSVVHEAHPRAIVKVIIETSLLSDDEKKKACELALKAGSDFVKTSTGFSGGGAKVEDIRLMKSIVGDRMGIKASGGIRDLETAIAMLEAGANRLGTSSGVKIIQDQEY